MEFPLPLAPATFLPAVVVPLYVVALVPRSVALMRAPSLYQSVPSLTPSPSHPSAAPPSSSSPCRHVAASTPPLTRVPPLHVAKLPALCLSQYAVAVVLRRWAMVPESPSSRAVPRRVAVVTSSLYRHAAATLSLHSTTTLQLLPTLAPPQHAAVLVSRSQAEMPALYSSQYAAVVESRRWPMELPSPRAVPRRVTVVTPSPCRYVAVVLSLHSTTLQLLPTHAPPQHAAMLVSRSQLARLALCSSQRAEPLLPTSRVVPRRGAVVMSPPSAMATFPL